RHTTFSRDWSSDVCSSDLDQLSGGDGDDILRGGPGVDTLIGARGNDVYLIGSGDELTVIKQSDSRYGQRDVIRFMENILPESVRSEERRVGQQWRSGWRP